MAKPKEITYRINEKGCHICTSHRPNAEGYCRIERKGRSIPMHRYLYEQKYGPLPKGYVAMHKCDTPGCINLDHIVAGTQADNIHDMYQKGRGAIGSRAGNHKLTEDDVRQIFGSSLNNVELGEKYGVRTQVIQAIRAGKRWKHVTGGKQDMTITVRRSTGARPKITREQAEEIRNIQGMSYREIGIKYGITASTVCLIRQGKCWK